MSSRSNTAEKWYLEPGQTASYFEHQLELLPPESLTQPLWKSLILDLRDTFAPEKLPPLQLTSRPIDLGLPLGEQLAMPWFRTIFTNIGNVLSPESLPPLELESRPVDVGELITDQLSHYWWTSLLRNLADRIAPEHMPALELTAKPVADIVPRSWLLLPLWSEVISTPKVFYPDKPKTAESTRPLVLRPVPLTAVDTQPASPEEAEVRRDIGRSRIRQRIWITLAAAQAVYLIVMAVWR